MVMTQALPVVIEVIRGATVESRHRGSIIAVEPDGSVVAQVGNPELITSTRSAIKPFQAIPLITSGAADRFNITARELAVACGSHSGEALHTYTVARLLARIGLDEHALKCGPHRPLGEETALKLERQGSTFTQLHNNCSGKHAGMLATAVHLGLSTDDYLSPTHPVQRTVAAMLAQFAGVTAELPIATDGCSAPTFALSLKSLALAFARLVMPWKGAASNFKTTADFTEGSKRVIAAMTSQPEMVGGTKGRLDSDLMRVTRGRLVAKIGAEAVHGIGVLPGPRFPRGLGIAVKIEDGSRRALDPTVIETLSQLELLSDSELLDLSQYHRPMLQNCRALTVGHITTVFDIGVERKSTSK
jgi:L-asparaginase II